MLVVLNNEHDAPKFPIAVLCNVCLCPLYANIRITGPSFHSATTKLPPKMGPPRRNPPQTPQILSQQSQRGSNDEPPSTIAQTPSMSLGMSPSERYESNLRVLRKRDPSIVSIFDQFGHVCVYHYVNKKWEKNGYEGSMFLFER